jgi:hypothetical protein
VAEETNIETSEAIDEHIAKQHQEQAQGHKNRHEAQAEKKTLGELAALMLHAYTSKRKRVASR